MHKLQFAVPVRISPSVGEPVEEIYSVEQALDFLRADDAAFAARLGLAGQAPAQVFAELRARKDRA